MPRHYFGEILNAKEPKLVSLDYLIVHGLYDISKTTYGGIPEIFSSHI